MIYNENELKYLVKYIPYNELNLLQETTVYRKYLSINPEIRINKRVFSDGKERYHLVIKKFIDNSCDNACLIRNKTKIEITKEQYDQLYHGFDEKPMIIKVVDFLYDDYILGFKTIVNTNIRFVEIEFTDIGELSIIRENIEKLSFIGDNVSNHSEYLMSNIWQNLIRRKLQIR